MNLSFRVRASNTATLSLKATQTTRLLTQMSATSQLNLMLLTCNRKIHNLLSGEEYIILLTCSPEESDTKETDMKALPGPEESERATRGLAWL